MNAAPFSLFDLLYRRIKFGMALFQPDVRKIRNLRCKGGAFLICLSCWDSGLAA